MPGYDSIHKGNIVDAAVSAVIAGKAGIQGVLVNGSEVEPDPDTNEVDITVPTLLSSTGQSTTEGMTQKAITDAIGSSVSGIAGVKVNGVELEKDSANKVDVPVPVLESTTGSSTTAGMTQKAITDALGNKADSSSLSDVATSGSYDDLLDKPTIPTLLSSTGQSTTEGMTQKAITDAIGSSTSGIAGVKVNGVELEKDSANKVNVLVPELESSTGSSTTAGMTQASITNELNSKVDISSIVQVTGSSTTDIMSQSAVSSAISDAGSEVKVVQKNGTDLTPDSSGKVNVIVPILESSTGSSTTAGMTQSAITTALSSKADSSGLSTVATSGSYNDLSNKPSLKTVATSGLYSDLTGTPNLSAVATSGSYNDLSNKPTIPTLLSTTGSSTTEGMTQDAITTELSGKATVSKYTATLSTSWTGSSAPYTQTVSVSGVLSTDTPIVDVVLSSTTQTAISQLEGWGCVSKIETSNGSITATCLEEKPTVSIPIQMCVVR